MGNGPEESGEGAKFKGRGLIQVTGKDNYFWFGASLDLTPEQASEYLETFEGAAQSACWFWETNKLNALADAGDEVLVPDPYYATYEGVVASTGATFGTGSGVLAASRLPR